MPERDRLSIHAEAYGLDSRPFRSRQAGIPQEEGDDGVLVHVYREPEVGQGEATGILLSPEGARLFAIEVLAHALRIERARAQEPGAPPVDGRAPGALLRVELDDAIEALERVLHPLYERRARREPRVAG